MHTRFKSDSLKRGDQLGDLRIKGMIILKWVIMK